MCQCTLAVDSLSFGTEGSGEGQLNGPKGVAIDNTTGALYVCDMNNDRVVVY